MIDPKRAYARQKAGAARRGLEFKLTYEQWLEFWGNDLAQRGNGACNLQMQRYGDLGGYELGNIKKGLPRENARTAGICRQNRACLRRAQEHQQSLDRLMFEESADETEESDLAELGYAASIDRRYSFAADKGR